MKRILACTALLFHFLSFAQNPPAPGLEDPEPPSLIINQIEIILFFTAIYLGVYFIFRKLKKKEENSFPEKKLQKESEKSNYK